MRRALSVLIAATMLVGVVALPAAASGGNQPTLAGKILAEADKKNGRYNIIGQVVGILAGAADKGDIETDLLLAADREVEATAFLPTDVAFRRLVADLGLIDGKNRWWQVKESEVIGALAEALPLQTINNIVEYHVIPGKVDYKTALSLDTNRRNGTNVFVPTLLDSSVSPVSAVDGATIGVDRRGFALQIDDAGTVLDISNNPFVVQANKNGGVNGIIHGISEVLLP